MREKKIPQDPKSDRRLQNHFTAYLTKALINNRIHYINRKAKLDMVDLYDEFPDETMMQMAEKDLTVEMYEQEYADEMDTIGDLTLLYALRALSEKDRTIIRLHVIYGYSYREVANMLGMTPTSVSTRYSRAIAQIRQRMEASK